MPIHFFCSTCGKPLEADASLASQEVRCRACGGATRVPAPRPAPQNPTAAQPAVPSAADKPAEENYELVDDDLPASSATHAARPTPQGLPVGKVIQSASAAQGQPVQTPRGVPVGKVVGPTGSTPTTAAVVPGAAAKQPASPAAKQSLPEGADSKSSAQTPVVGKPIRGANSSSATTQRAVSSKPTVPSKPAAPSEPTLDNLPEAALPDPGDLAQWSESQASAPRCEQCLTVLGQDSSVCPSCGYDAAVPPPPLQDLSAELASPIVRKGRKSGQRSGGPVPLGLYAACAAQALVLVAVTLQLLGTLSDEPLRVDAPSTLAMAAATCAGLGFLCTTAASVLCLLAPKQSRTRGMIYLKSGCDIVAIALVVAFLRQLVPWSVLLLASALEIAAVLLVLLFMKTLAEHLGDGKLVERAERLLWKTAAFVGAVGLAYGFSAMIGSETFLAVRIAGIIVWAYLLFHFTLIAQELAPAIGAKQTATGGQ